MPAATDGMEEIVKQFLAESAEGLDRLERGLVELEHDPGSRDRLAEIFRAVHTIKGTSGMLGYLKLESVAHAGESLLDGLRNGRLEPNQSLISGLLAMVDVLRRLLGAIERTGGEGSEDCGSVVRSLEELARCTVAPKGLAGPLYTGVTDNPPGEPAAAKGTIRVDVGLLDQLMDLAGELVLARNQIQRLTALQSDSAIVRATQRLKRLATDMQDAVMKSRLQPIGSVWNRFHRLARDLALSCGKQVTVEMEGSETELDRGIIEAIRDPLTHILRNAIAHGIETAEQRTRCGKTAAGHLRLRAFHREGWVHVELSDDGAGIGVERVRQRALERGLITAEEASRIDERQLAGLVFAPGFSTAEQVTSVSGRGVGLDVVRANIEKIGGVVDLRSVTGEGTTLHIRIPLTLAILPVLIVASAGQRFAIPQANLAEVVRVQGGTGTSPIEQVCESPVYRLRDRLLPLCFLDRELHLESGGQQVLHIVVLEAGTRQFGLVVDAVHDTEEVVVKPLGAQLRAIACFAGATILGDGQVVLVLDVAGLAQLAGVTAGPSLQPPSPAAQPSEAQATDVAVNRWLVFRGTSGSRFALPLSAVERLEELPSERIERSAGREVVQYNGAILPLLRAARLFHEPENDRKLLQVAVLRDSGRSAGLVVERIEDIVEEVPELHTNKPHSEMRPDLLEGSTVIQQRVTNVLNLKSVLERGQRHSGPADGSL